MSSCQVAAWALPALEPAAPLIDHAEVIPTVPQVRSISLPRTARHDEMPVFVRCPLCRETERRKQAKLAALPAPRPYLCDRCLAPIAEPAPPTGYVAQTWDHFHVTSIQGLPAREPAMDTLCAACFAGDIEVSQTISR